METLKTYSRRNISQILLNTIVFMNKPIKYIARVAICYRAKYGRCVPQTNSSLITTLSNVNHACTRYQWYKMRDDGKEYFPGEQIFTGGSIL